MEESTSSSEPPYNDKEPKNEYKEDDVPQPTTSLSFCHVIHSAECPCEDAACFRKRIVHLAELNRRLSDLVSNANGDILEKLDLGR